MSYAWLLPPLCDPVDGHLLMDGCYVNNVPGDVMATQGCKYILAIDVTALDDRDLTNYGDTLSGLWILWQKINPFAEPVKIPHQSEIQMRLAFCSHYKNLEELKNNPNYEYIQPPIDKYASGAVIIVNKKRQRVECNISIFISIYFSSNFLTKSATSDTITATPFSRV